MSDARENLTGEHWQFLEGLCLDSPFEVLITDPPPPLTDTVDGAASPSLSKKDLKKEKEDKKREEKERAKREKEEKAATLKKDKKVSAASRVDEGLLQWKNWTIPRIFLGNWKKERNVQIR